MGDLVDVVVDESDLLEDAARWMAIARVHMTEPYSPYLFYWNMREVKFRPLNFGPYSLGSGAGGKIPAQ